jgi:hypothetical protein
MITESLIANHQAPFVNPEFAMRQTLSLSLVLVATVTCAGQTGPSRVEAPSAEALLKDSGIHYVESGGIAGRVTEAQFEAVGARVTAGYRGPDLHAPEGLQKGTVDNDAYVALWREGERLNLWTIQAPRRGGGADLIESELRIRQGTRSHVIRWNETTATSDEVRDVAAWARRVLAVAREYAAFR